MKPINAIQRLKELAIQEKRRLFPSVPLYAIKHPNYSDKKANGLTACIIDFIRLKGGQAERINNTGRMIDRRETFTDILGHKRTIGGYEWIRGTGTNGTADISATVGGRSVKIEVKIGRDRQSPAQIQYQKSIEKAGGLYFLAKDFESFFLWYSKTFEQ
jgi:hypothetical protein